MSVLIVLGCWLVVSVLAAAVWAAVGGLVAQPQRGTAAQPCVSRAVPDDERAPAADTPRAG